MNRNFFYSVVFLSVVHFVNAQFEELSIAQQVPMLVKVLSFDKNAQVEKKDYVIGILYQNTIAASEAAQQSIMQFHDTSQLILSNGTIARFTTILIGPDDNWKTTAEEKKLSAVIVTPVDQSLVREISRFCREQKIVSMTTVAEYVNEGLTLGIAKIKGKQVILINLPGSLGEGVNFSSQVLRIAKVHR